MKSQLLHDHTTYTAAVT